MEVNFDELEPGSWSSQCEQHDMAFCTLGTTKKKAGSAEAFRKVDLDYTVKFAQAVKAQGTRHFALMSSG